MKDNFDIFFRRKPALMLIALKKLSRARYGSILAKEVDCTYSHAVKILQTLEKLELVTFEKQGRIKLIKLTKRGAEIADNIDNIKSPFYAMVYHKSPNIRILIQDSSGLGNGCALYTRGLIRENALVPCQMETEGKSPEWRECILGEMFGERDIFNQLKDVHVITNHSGEISFDEWIARFGLHRE
jgi:DNA-binding MarR family transcriptional regulator